ncbi:hypothetical protein pb186bvf_006764 [Paramecium bursaria]
MFKFCREQREEPTLSQLHAMKLQNEIHLIENQQITSGQDFVLLEVQVEYQGQSHFIHTFVGGRDDKPIALLLHGYGGSNVHYSRMYKELIKMFHVYSIDLPGMGFSSKGDINISDRDNTLNFFMGTIGNFIQKTFQGQKINLFGHSFGGYIAAQLASRYPQYIDKLFLLSPAGTTFHSQEEIKKLQDFSQQIWYKRWIINFARSYWQNEATIKDLSQKWYGPMFMKRYLSKRLQLSGREYELWLTYINDMLSLPIGSEKALFRLFQFPRVMTLGEHSIQYLIRNSESLKNIPIFFYFGVHDWMDSEGAKRLVNEQQFPNIKIRLIENADHQITFQNPQGCISQIQEDLNLNNQTNNTIFVQNRDFQQPIKVN